MRSSAPCSFPRDQGFESVNFDAPPTYYFRKGSADGTLGQTTRGQLHQEGSGYASGFKYNLDERGTLTITTKSLDAPVRLDLTVFGDNKVPVASTRDQADPTHLDVSEL